MGPIGPECGSQLGHRTEPDQPAGGEDPDPVTDRLDLGEQVAGKENRHAALVDQVPEQAEDADHADGIDGRRGLVEDQNLRILDEGIGDAEPLEHAPR